MTLRLLITPAGTDSLSKHDLPSLGTRTLAYERQVGDNAPTTARLPSELTVGLEMETVKVAHKYAPHLLMESPQPTFVIPVGIKPLLASERRYSLQPIEEELVHRSTTPDCSTSRKRQLTHSGNQAE